MFVVIFSAVLGVLCAYVGRRGLRDTQVPALWRRIGWGVIMLGTASIPASFFLHGLLSVEARYWYSLIAYGWLGALFYLWLFFFVWDAWRVVLSLVRRVLSRPSARHSSDAADGVTSETVDNPERRIFVSRVVAVTAAVSTLGIGVSGVRSALGDISTPEVSVRLSRLPKALDGFRIAQLSDVHIGPLLGSRFLRNVVDETNRMHPDLIVITGDLVDGSVAEIGESVKLLGGLRARHGVYFVTGNHEYYSGCEQWVEFLRGLGVTVLMNQRVSIGDVRDGASFDLLGVPDHHARPLRPNMRAVAKGRDAERELVVLAHQPVQIGQSLDVGAGLQLSGHTHGGQIQPFGQLVALAQPFVAGLHRAHDTQIYVSRGTGFWGPPMRVLAPAEITRIELVSG